MKILFYTTPVIAILFLSFIGFDQPYKNGIYKTYEDYLAGNLTKESITPLSYTDVHQEVVIQTPSHEKETISKGKIYGYQQRNQFYRCRKDKLSFRLLTTTPFPLYAHFKIATGTQYSSGGPITVYYFSKDLESKIIKISKKSLMAAFPTEITTTELAESAYHELYAAINDAGPDVLGSYKGIYSSKENHRDHYLRLKDRSMLRFTKGVIELSNKDLRKLTYVQKQTLLPSESLKTEEIWGVSFELTEVIFSKGKVYTLIGTSDMFDVYLQTTEDNGLGFLYSGWDCHSYFFVKIKRGVDYKYLNKMLQIDGKVTSKILGVSKDKMKSLERNYGGRDRLYQVLRSKYDIEEVIWK